MGKSNRARRAAKKRRDDRRRPEGGGPTQGRSQSGESWQSPGRQDLRYLLVAAARGTGTGRGRAGDHVMEPLFEAAAGRGSSALALALDEVFGRAVASAWEGGWQPAELVRAVRRRLGERHGDLLSTAVAAEHSTRDGVAPDEWATQLVEVEAAEQWWGRGRDWLGPWSLRMGTPRNEALRIAVEVLAVLIHLPVMENVVPPPSQWGSSPLGAPVRPGAVDEGILAKVRALLAQAESTNFEHEAAALTAKAQELMSRHAIDEAVAGAGSSAIRETPRARRIPVDDPYAAAKSVLVSVVAAANGVRCVWHDDLALMTLVGFESDLAAVDLLFTSLVVQATKAVLAQGRVLDAWGRSRTRSFRQSFYVAFADRIAERLHAANQQARDSAERDLGRSLLPVLASRKDDVDDYTSKLFPRLGSRRSSSVTNVEGWRAGRTAAEMATLGPVHQRLEGAG
jgi:hypothetical protein